MYTQVWYTAQCWYITYIQYWRFCRVSNAVVLLVALQTAMNAQRHTCKQDSEKEMHLQQQVKSLQKQLKDAEGINDSLRQELSETGELLSHFSLS